MDERGPEPIPIEEAYDLTNGISTGDLLLLAVASAFMVVAGLAIALGVPETMSGTFWGAGLRATRELIAAPLQQMGASPEAVFGFGVLMAAVGVLQLVITFVETTHGAVRRWVR